MHNLTHYIYRQFQRGRLMLVSIIALLSCWASSALADYQMNMIPGVTPISHNIYELHMAAFWTCVGIGVVVFGVMGYSIVMHRKSRGAVAADFHEHGGLEIAWSVIPLLILIVLATPATIVLMRMEDSGNAAINIKVTGYQWKWKYEYLDQGITFFSNLATPQDQMQNKAPKGTYYLQEVDNPMVIPINKKVRFLVTANDVIHSWWVPALGIKQDAIPGFIHEAWASVQVPGTYRGQCAELCGAGHGFMPIVVIAKTQKDFDSWVKQKTADQKLPLDLRKSTNLPVITPAAATTVAAPASAPAKMTFAELMQKGQVVYEAKCAVCHQTNGKGMPGVFPAISGGAVSTGPVKAQISLVMHGKPGTAMQSFAEQLTNEEIAAVITYERNALGNKTGTVVEPADILKAR